MCMLVLVSCVFPERYPFLLCFQIYWYRLYIMLSNGLPTVREVGRDALCSFLIGIVSISLTRPDCLSSL